MAPRAPYFIFKKVFGFLFGKKICGAQKTGFSPKNRKNRFLRLLKANLARKMFFSRFFAQNQCFRHNFEDSENLLDFLSQKNFWGVKKVIFQP